VGGNLKVKGKASENNPGNGKGSRLSARKEKGGALGKTLKLTDKRRGLDNSEKKDGYISHSEKRYTCVNLYYQEGKINEKRKNGQGWRGHRGAQSELSESRPEARFPWGGYKDGRGGKNNIKEGEEHLHRSFTGAP